MLHKTTILLLFVFVSIKGFSQDTLKTNSFITNTNAIIEISRNGGFDDETIYIHFDDGKMADITDKINVANTDLSLAQKVLRSIKYMKAQHYFLISSTASSASGNHPSWVNYYDYQYIFEKR